MDNKNYALITGASSGIGKECAKRLAAAGKNLILIARRLEKLEELKKELKTDVLVYRVDIRDMKNVEDFYEQIADKSIDAVINNAGLARTAEKFENISWEDIEEMIETNIKGFTKIAHLSVPFLKKTKGHIINISSIAGIRSYPGGSVYCGSKAFVKMLSQAIRIELSESNVRVTDIAPGVVDTDFWDVRFRGDLRRAKKAYENFTPLHAADIAECVLFALSRPEHVNIDTMLVMPFEDAR
jgi:3-hydroxy acid dehydrogenase / malonic semialdehyde reductase